MAQAEEARANALKLSERAFVVAANLAVRSVSHLRKRCHRALCVFRAGVVNRREAHAMDIIWLLSACRAAGYREVAHGCS